MAICNPLFPKSGIQVSCRTVFDGIGDKNNSYDFSENLIGNPMCVIVNKNVSVFCLAC